MQKEFYVIFREEDGELKQVFKDLESIDRAYGFHDCAGICGVTYKLFKYTGKEIATLKK